MQLISFGHETISVLKHINSTGHPDPSLAQSGKFLEDITSELENELRNKPKPLSSKDNQLLDIATECVKASKDLRTSVAGVSVSGGQKAQKRAILASAFKSIRNRSVIQRQEKTLIRCQQNLQTYLAMHSGIKLDALEVQNHEDFVHQSHELQFFIRQYAAGNTGLEQLIARESNDIKTHITKESSKVQSHQRDLTQKRQEQELTSTTERQYEHLLTSLKFPSMNERKNQIGPQRSGTFPWIFDVCDDDHSLASNSDKPNRPLSSSSRSSSSDEELYEHLHGGGGAFYPSDDKCFETKYWHGFPEWLKSAEKLYWISGKPGSGKSTLMKHISSACETKNALSDWCSDTQVLSHFLWSPGSPMQRNIKGLLCSLLCQAYQGDKQLVLRTMINLPSLLSKDSHIDWSLEELRKSLFTLMRETQNHFCIFLDGLDEIDQKDGLHSLLRLLDKLKDLPRVKLCVSSRPELAITRHLNNYPSLRIQEYTSKDIWIYAKKTLQIPTAVEKDLEIVRTIVAKAAGVFLWAVLVSKSLKRGLANGDQWPEIRARLGSLPADMMELYYSMWQRLGEDRKWYSETAALYFEIVLVESNYGGMNLLKNEQISIFELTASTDSDVQNSFIERNEAMPVADLEQQCSRTVERLMVCCAGLLEVHPAVEFDRLVVDSHDEKYNCLWPYTTQVVAFIHRTARDFLTSTEEGKEIRKRCSQEAAMVALAKGCLIQCRLWNFKTYDIHAADALRLLGFVHEFPQMPENKLVQIIAKWHKEGYLIRGQGHTSFTAIAAYMGLIAYVEEQIALETVDLLEPNLLILRGACTLSFPHTLSCWDSQLRGNYKGRHELIRRLLRDYVVETESETANGQISMSAEPTEPITSVFVCFLDSSLALLDGNFPERLQHNVSFLSWSKEILATLRAFILKGVDVRTSIYTAIRYSKYFTAGFCSLYYMTQQEPIIYVETNIPFLVNCLLSRLHPKAGALDGDNYSRDSRYVRVRMFSIGESDGFEGCDSSDVHYTPGNVEDEAYIWNVVKPLALNGPYLLRGEEWMSGMERLIEALKLVLPRAFPTDGHAILHEIYKHAVPFLREFDDPRSAVYNNGILDF
ncbi:MAG: hypothetical protein LQ340_000898 [Diploschistes diacapsis]|nr:MAG: hypothetical protein LQ340_000898 [Diploschistes diacapsis]